MTWKRFTFSRFILTICSKLPFFLHGVLWTSKIQNLYILTRMDGGIMLPLHFSDVQSALFRCAISLFQISTSASLSFCSCFYEDLLLFLQWWAPVFMMIHSCFHDEVLQYRLNPHGYSLDFVSDVDCNSFLPRIQNSQARKILVSSRENFILDTRTNYIPYENQVHSGKEWSVFS